MDISGHEPIEETGAAGGDGVRELKALCDNGFDGNTGAAALALGRDEAQITDMMNGTVEIDEDLIMKVHGIAAERGIDLG